MTQINQDYINNLKTKLNKVNNQTKIVFGIMTVGQIICHMTDQIKMALGEIPVKDKSNFISRTFIKFLVTDLGLPAPKEKVKTLKEINQSYGNGTSPSEIEKDKEELFQCLKKVSEIDKQEAFRPHPVFGQLSIKQWNTLIHSHIKHHCSQFDI